MLVILNNRDSRMITDDLSVLRRKDFYWGHLGTERIKSSTELSTGNPIYNNNFVMTAPARHE